MLDALIILIVIVVIGLFMLWRLIQEIRGVQEYLHTVLCFFLTDGVVQGIAASGRQTVYHLEELRKQIK
jgi:hypothetical protein